MRVNKTTVMVEGVKCLSVRGFNDAIPDLLEISGLPDREKSAPVCVLCPLDRWADVENDCGMPCGDYSIYINAKYLPILKMRGLIHED